MQKYRVSFAVSEFGRIYAQLPLKEMAEKIRSHFHKTHHQGNTAGRRDGADVPQVLDLRNVLIISKNWPAQKSPESVPTPFMPTTRIGGTAPKTA